MTLRVTREGVAAILTLDRPDRANALDRPLLQELARAGRELLHDPRVRAVIVTGAGSRVFSAGADLKERRSMTDDEVRAMLDLFREAFGWLSRAPFPTVAALNGTALGGGLELALACDLRVAVPHAELGLPETSLAILPAAGGTQRLPRLVGYARALELILLGTRLTAEQALGFGLLNRVSPAGADVLADTLAFLAPVLEGAPIAQREALRAVRGALELPLAEGLDHERRAYEQCLLSEDRREALRAFAEQRKPRFNGQ